MKKLAFLSMLLLTASMAMAQFGKLENLADGNGNNNGTTTDETGGNGNGVSVGIGTINRNSIMEKAIVDGFFLVKQDFQLEDTTNGNRYNWEGGKEFGGSTSFMVKLSDGYVTSDDILAPWDYDENYSQYKGQKYRPVPIRTSFMTINQKEWKVQSSPLQFDAEDELANGLKYMKVEGEGGDGFIQATGLGKKEVWVVWLMTAEAEGESASIRGSFRLSQMELTLEKKKRLYEMEAPNTNMKVMGGIVVEPVYRGIGHIDLALVGVIGQYEDKYQMALLNTEMGDEDDDSSDGSSMLTPTEESDQPANKENKKSKSSKKRKK